MSRRGVLGISAALTLEAAWGGQARAAPAHALFKAIGITAKIDRAAEMKRAGADFIVESVADFLVPFADDAVFEPHAQRARGAGLPILGCNSFLRDPRLICVGPRADHPLILKYADVAFRRLHGLGGRYVVFGSNTSRHIPEGFGRARAGEQFVELLESMAPLAKRSGVTIGIEMQKAQECNYLNRIDEVSEVVRKVDHPSVRVLADLYHMRVMGDSPSDLERSMRWVSLVELAERDERTLPGVRGDDFRPYFEVLARHAFRGYCDIEGDGTAGQLHQAFATVRTQAVDAARMAAEHAPR